MRIAPEHAEEERRLRSLRDLQLLDTQAEERFDRLTQLAATVLEMPIALVSLVDRDRQWFKSKFGLEAVETARELAFCAHAIVADGTDVFTVEDATLDDRFADNPLVTGDPQIRFYAGQPLHDALGMPVGTLCVIDRQPRQLTAMQRDALAHIAALVEAEFNRRTVDDLVGALADSEARKSLVLDNVSEGLVLQDTSGAILQWNPAAERLLGMTGDDLAGRMSTDPRWAAIQLDGAPWPAGELPSMVALATGRAVRGATMGVHQPNGRLQWLRVNAQPILDEAGTAIQVVTTFADIDNEVIETQRRKILAAALQRNEETARLSLDALEQGVLFADPTGVIHRMNPAAERILGNSASELTAMWTSGTWTTYDENWVPLADGDRPIRQAVLTGHTVVGRIVGWRRSDGSRILVRMSVIPNTDGAGSLVIAFTDITNERLAQRLLDATLETAPVGLAVLDTDRTILRCNKMFADHAGRQPDELIGTDVLQLIMPDDQVAAAAVGRRLRVGMTAEAQLDQRVNRPDGVELWVNTHLAVIADPDRPLAIAATQDVTERIHLNERLAHRALHDPLTDLPNRQLLETTLQLALERAKVDGSSVGLCFIDLDGFKQVNDTLGHAAGDRVIVTVAERIRASIRKGDLAARVGGDEFVVVLDPVADTGHALTVATRLRDALTRVSTRAGDLTCGASVGLAVSEPGDTVSTLLSRADAAMYRAKARAGSGVELETGEHPVDPIHRNMHPA